MANWRKLALAAILADGKIDQEEVKLLRKELWADGKIDDDEVRFLVDLRNLAQKKAKAQKAELHPKFEQLFFKAVEEFLLEDGVIDAAESGWLRGVLFADGKIDANEKKFLNRIKKVAKSTSPEFERLYEDCMMKK